LLFDNDTIYGLTVDSSWTFAQGGFFLLRRLEYDKNGGSGTEPSAVEQQTGTPVTVAQGDGLTRNGYRFSHWNMADDGSGASYAAGASLTLSKPMKLYAQWTIAPPTPSPTPTPTATVKPTVPPFEPLPPTGDRSVGWPWVLLLAASGTGVFYTLRHSRKRRGTGE
jgi:hypothetical protein